MWREIKGINRESHYKGGLSVSLGTNHKKFPLFIYSINKIYRGHSIHRPTTLTSRLMDKR